MMEYWNIGKMAMFALKIKFKMDYILRKPNMSSFHYSIVP
jgi:hypothetical protein